MKLVKWNPGLTTRPFFSDFFEDFFNTDITRPFWDNNLSTSPAVNVRELNDKFIIEVAAPGLKKEDFYVKVDRDLLSISVEKDYENKNTDDSYMRREYVCGQFKRSFSLPDTVKSDKIDASYTDGILSIDIPKKKGAESSASRVIKIS